MNIHISERTTSPRYQVQLTSEKAPHAHNSQYIEQQTGSTNVSTVQVIQSVGEMFQDLFHSDNAKVSATLDALNHDFVVPKRRNW
jgi:hypothetical protein